MPEKLQLSSAQIGSPRNTGEGLRIGVVRFLPRGVYKKDYAGMNYFDVWLPSLAPSRELLAQLKSGSVTNSRFYARYRMEMKNTENAQTIVLLAELAKRMSISIGCYCEDESLCHRSVLLELIRQSGNEPTSPLARSCVYTIVHPDTLAQACKKEEAVTLIEAKSWVTARQLFDQAKRDGESMPILFGDSTDCSKLTHWGILRDINLSDDGTEYTFSSLKAISSRRSPQELTLLSTGKKIDEGFIRPYAICKTPNFL